MTEEKNDTNIEPVNNFNSEIGKIVQNPRVTNYLGKSIKIIAAFAVVGCILLVVAITAISNILTNALPK